MTDKSERDYYLGTHDDEVARLGLQHRVWRPRTLDAWRRAGITTGSNVIDAGAGPGYASLDLAEIVAPGGQVHALERSTRFLDALHEYARERHLDNIIAHNIDLVDEEIPITGADAFWVRWVLAFINRPAAVLAKLAGALKPGGKAIIHEYLDWGTLNWTPRRPALQRFVEATLSAWRESGGEPDVAVPLIPMLPSVGLKVIETRPIIDIVTPSNFVWRWIGTFLPSHVHRLARDGKLSATEESEIIAAFDAATADPACYMTTPMVLEIIAEKI